MRSMLRVLRTTTKKKLRWLLLVPALLVLYASYIALDILDHLWLAESLYRGDGEYWISGWMYSEHDISFPKAELSDDTRLEYRLRGFAGGGGMVTIDLYGVPLPIAEESGMRFHARLVESDSRATVWASTADLYKDPYHNPEDPYLLYYFKPVIREISRFQQYRLVIKTTGYDRRFDGATYAVSLSRGAIDWYGEYRD